MLDGLKLPLFYKVLLFIEDKGEVEISRLRRLGSRRPVFGALGRLRSMGYVKRIKTDSADTVALTPLGDEAIATLLDFVPQPNDIWDGRWRMMLLEVPQSKQAVRQTLRLKLIEFGARKLEPSVWVTPRQLIANRFLTYITHHGYAHYVHVFDATALPAYEIDITGLWQIDQLHHQYGELLKQFNRLGHALDCEPDAAYIAKCMILTIALIAKQDPILPLKLLPKRWNGTRIHWWHAKLRAIANRGSRVR